MSGLSRNKSVDFPCRQMFEYARDDRCCVSHPSIWRWKRNGYMFPEQTFLFRYRRWRRVAFFATLVLLLSGGEAHAAWTVKRIVDAATGQARCYLESTP